MIRSRSRHHHRSHHREEERRGRRRGYKRRYYSRSPSYSSDSSPPYRRQPRSRSPSTSSSRCSGLTSSSSVRSAHLHRSRKYIRPSRERGHRYERLHVNRHRDDDARYLRGTSSHSRSKSRSQEQISMTQRVSDARDPSGTSH